MKSPFALLPFAALLGCGSPDTAPPPPPTNPPVDQKPRDPMPPPASPERQSGVWSGPPVHANFVSIGGALHIQLSAPTAGFEFVCTEITLVGTTAEVRCQMTKPKDEIVAQVVTEHPLEITPDRLPAEAKDMALLISTWERGVSYFRAPDHERVLTLPIPR
ncbi:MAG: hypothetical protein IPK26_11555 [Planctomycetes bacterium]|nr:hypothetical protein [Planctomycetota bacterium]